MLTCTGRAHLRRDWDSGRPHLRWDWDSPRPHLLRDWRPHLLRDWRPLAQVRRLPVNVMLLVERTQLFMLLCLGAPAFT